MTERYVLDSWALLALLLAEEPAASQVRRLLHKADNQSASFFMSVINLGELYYTIGQRKGRTAAKDTLAEIHRLPITIIGAPGKTVLATADVKIDYGISYADAFAAATAHKLGAVLVTGDPELLAMKGKLKVKALHRDR